MLPPVITALGFLLFWVNAGLYGNMIATLISHAIFFVTLPLVTISLGLESIDRQIIEASTIMGADERTVFRTVVIPLVRPYLVSGYAFAFVLSLNEYIVSYMVSGLTIETLPIKIFNSLRYGYTPVMASVAVLFVVVGFVVYGLIARFGDLPRLLGAWAAHLMFDLPVLQLSVKARHGPGQWAGEGVATFGLILTILGTARHRPQWVAATVALYITAAYWFTSSTSFANPAITVARSLSDTFAGIAPADVPAFVAAQLAGAALAAVVGRWLFGVEAITSPGS